MCHRSKGNSGKKQKQNKCKIPSSHDMLAFFGVAVAPALGG